MRRTWWDTLHTFPEQVEPEETPYTPQRVQKHWGWHYLVDADGANENIDNPTVIKDYLDSLLEKLNLKPLSETFVAYSQDEYGRGFSGIVLLTTSHASIHCDDVKRSIYFDIFVCKSFDPSIALDHLIQYFAPKHVAHVFFVRDAGKPPVFQKEETS